MSTVQACVGNLQWGCSILAGVHIVIGVGGSIPIADGIGLLIIRGVGLRSIMAAGFVITVWDGVGRQIRFGGLPGFAGGTPMIIAAGLLCLPWHISDLGWGSIITDIRWGSALIMG